MTSFELMFEVESPNDDLVDRLYDSEDAIISSHSGLTLVTMTFEGVSAMSAAKCAVIRLEELGFVVARLYEDLVTRTEIAERASVTPQAVGSWIRGERQATQHGEFPKPFSIAGGSRGLWLWREVNEWLKGLGKDDGVEYPSRLDYLYVNEWMVSRTCLSRYTKVGQVQVSTARSVSIPLFSGGSVTPSNSLGEWKLHVGVGM